MEDFVPYELAVKLKEKGFTCEYPFAMYNKYEQFCPLYSSDKHYFGIDDFDKHACIAPTISQALKWLREDKKIYICISYDDVCVYSYDIVGIMDGEFKGVEYDYETYEQAAIAGIEYVIYNLI